MSENICMKHKNSPTKLVCSQRQAHTYLHHSVIQFFLFLFFFLGGGGGGGERERCIQTPQS